MTLCFIEFCFGIALKYVKNFKIKYRNLIYLINVERKYLFFFLNYSVTD